MIPAKLNRHLDNSLPTDFSQNFPMYIIIENHRCLKIWKTDKSIFIKRIVKRSKIMEMRISLKRQLKQKQKKLKISSWIFTMFLYVTRNKAEIQTQKLLQDQIRIYGPKCLHSLSKSENLWRFSMLRQPYISLERM